MMRGHLLLTRWRQAQLVQAVIASALLFACAAAHAQSNQRAGLGLNWVRLEGAASCIASVDLMNRIEERLGRIVFVRTGEAVLTIDGYVRPAPITSDVSAGWLVTFEISDAHGNVLGRRDLDKLEGSDCGVVARAAELIVDLTLDPEGLMGAGIPLEPATQALLDELLRGEPSELDPSTLPAARAAAHQQAKKPQSKRELLALEPAEAADDDRVALDVSGVGMLGALPELAAGASLNLSVRVRPSWAFELSFLTLAEQAVDVPRYDLGAASFGYQSLSIALCRPLAWVELCGAAEYGRQSVSASGFRSLRGVQSRELLNVRAHATFRIDLFYGLFLRASAAAILPLLRQDYVYDSRQGDLRLFRTGLVVGRVELGLGLYI